MSEARGIHRRLEINVTDTLRSRFWKKVFISDNPDHCWEWLGAMRNNYGAIKHEGKVHSAHRIAYVLEHGIPEPGLVVAHKCDNRACCNPNHLEAITPGQNNTDARGRRTFLMARGEDVHNSVLTTETVNLIVSERKTTGESASRIAERLDLPLSAVRKVIEGVTWTHITGGRVDP